MAEPQAQSQNEGPALHLEVRFFPGSRALYLFAENPRDPVPVPADEVLQKLIVRLRGTSPATRQRPARKIETPYRVEGRIGGVPPRRPGQQHVRILLLEAMSPLALHTEERIRRRGEGSSCIDRIQLLWPDGREEVYERQSGRRLVFSRVTS